MNVDTDTESLHVLVIDDDEVDYLITRELLAESGGQFCVDWVAHFDPGLAAVLSGRYDVCLLDYRLGSRDGLEFLHEAVQRGCRCPIILLTGQDRESVDLGAMRAGAADYLDKAGLTGELLARSTRYAVERRRAAEALQHSEQRYGELVNSLDAIVWEADAITFQFSFVSRRAEEILGYPLREWLQHPDFWDRLIHPDDRSDARARFEAVRPDGRDHEFEHRAIAAGGRTVWLRNKVHVTRDSDGKPLRLRGVMVDITASKRAEEQLQDVVTGARCLLWSGRAREIRGVIGWRLKMSCEEAAQSFLPVDRKPGEPYEAAWYRSKLPEDLERMEELGNRALREGWCGYSQEFRCRRADGELRWLHEEVRITPDGPGRWSLVGVCTDVSERHRAEEDLRRSEERFRSLIDNAQDIISILSGDGTILYASPAIRRVLGYVPEELVGRSIFEFLHPDEEPVIRETLERDLAEPGCVSSGEFRFRHSDGSWRVMEGISKNLLDDPGVRGLVVNSRDVTERRLLEEQLRQSQKMEAVGRLAGGVAHDFNNMLAVITGYSELILGRINPGDPLRPPLDEIRRAADRAATLTRQLLAFSRKQVLAPKVLDLNEVVVGMEKMLRRLIGEDIRLSTRLAPDLGPIRADPGQVEQVIMNLAVNARDAMPEGGELIIRTSNLILEPGETVQLGQCDPGPHVLLSVSDTGCGMDEATASRIFEPFFTTKEMGRGTGLGLATVYGIVTQSAGGIRVVSRPGEGATFHVYFPQVAETEEALPEQQNGVKLPNGSETILLVEDEPMVRLFVRDVLSMTGYQVLEAADGSEAIQAGEGHAGPIHLLVTDVVMPGMNGRLLSERLSHLRPDMKVLFMSGYTDDTSLRDGSLSPGTAFIEKPFAPSAFARKVREVLDTY